jgi:DNA-binding response OmpR family regulator
MTEDTNHALPVNFQHKKILVINNSQTDLRLLFELAKPANMQFHMAFSGRDGLNKALLHQPDLILLDIALPDMEGFAVCRQFKAQASTRATPVIFLAATNRLADRLLGLSLGAVDFISKPFSEHEALARINIHLGLAHELKQLTMRLVKALPTKINSDLSSPNLVRSRDDTKGEFQTIERRRVVLVRLATQHLKQHLGSHPTPGELAQVVGTTERSLNEAFHAAFQLSVFGWLREERMRQACHLLTATDTTIASIGEYLGFSTPANFSRSFRERFVMSPREMRAGGPKAVKL